MADNQGTEGQDAIEGTDEKDNLKGLGGNDVLYGLDGDDVLDGGSGDDKLFGDFGLDTLTGGAGNDRLYGGLARNYAAGNNSGGSGTGAGTDTLDGGADIDTAVIDYHGVIVKELNKPFDVRLVFSDSAFSVGLTAGDAVFTGEKVLNCERLDFDGGDGAVFVVGSGRDDIIVSGGGIAQIDAGGGNDSVSDGPGVFDIQGGAGTDSLQLFRYGTAKIALNADAGTSVENGHTNRFGGFESLEFYSGSGADTLTGLSKGANTIDGGDGNDTITGGAKDDILTAGKGSDVVRGGAGNDTLLAGRSINFSDTGRDAYYGEAGNDVLTVSDIQRITKGSVFDGGSGTDKLVLLLDNERGFLPGETMSDLSGSTIAGFEKVLVDSPSSYAYTVKFGSAQFAQFKEVVLHRGDFGSGLTTVAFADAGKVSLNGRTVTADIFKLSDGGQTIDFRGVTLKDRVNVEVKGGAGNDTIFGPNGATFRAVVSGGDGNDTLTAGSSPVSFSGGAGDDVMKGGAGFDTVGYSGATTGVTVDLGLTGQQDTGGAGKDTISGFERLYGSAFDDVLTGGTGADTIQGGLGDDVIEGGKGADSFGYLDGFYAAETGASDTLSYAHSSLGVTVSLGTGTSTIIVASGGDAQGDRGSGFENLTGSAKADTLSGNDFDNVLKGGLGNDALTGGLGKDTFVFDAALTANIDHLKDFKVGEDRIALDATLFKGVTNANLKTSFHDITTAKQDSSDRILYDHETGVLSYDSDGLGTIKPVAFAIVDTHAALTAADFLIM